MAVRHIQEVPRQAQHLPAPPIMAPQPRAWALANVAVVLAGSGDTSPADRSSLRSWALDEFGTACSATGSVCVLDTRTCSRRHGRKQALNTHRGAPPHLAYALKLNPKTGILTKPHQNIWQAKTTGQFHLKAGQADLIAPPERTTLPNSQPILGRAVWIPGSATLEPSKRCLPQHARAVRPGTTEPWPSWLDR